LSIYQSDGVTLGTTFGANGNVTIAAPSSGQTLLVNQSLTGSTSATGALVVAGTAGAAAAQMLLCVQQNGFSNGLQISTDGTNMKYSFVNGNMTIGAPTSGGFTVTAQAFNAAGSAAFLANNNLPAGAAFYNENYTANNAALVMNSTGADFGTIGTVAAQVWGLGSTPSIGPVGTAALTWNNTGNVTIAAPSSGNTLTVSAAATQALVILGAGAGIGAISIAGCATVGTKTASMTATNKPGSNNQTTPSTWLPIVLDATNYYIPAYAA
jgi:hypothetical protein